MTEGRLGELEAKVMKAVWRLRRGTVHDVRDALGGRKRLAYTTVLTILRNLEKKGFLAHDLDGRSHVYRPLVEEDAVARSTLKDLVDKVFDGSRVRLVETLFEAEDLSEGEIEEIERRIRELREREGGDG